jgi:hypothetical protein
VGFATTARSISKLFHATNRAPDRICQFLYGVCNQLHQPVKNSHPIALIQAKVKCP